MLLLVHIPPAQLISRLFIVMVDLLDIILHDLHLGLPHLVEIDPFPPLRAISRCLNKMSLRLGPLRVTVWIGGMLVLLNKGELVIIYNKQHQKHTI